MKSQKTIIAAVICLSLGMNAFAQEEKSKDKKREKQTPEKMFESLDANKDGVLKKEEITNEKMSKRFDKMDTNSDGSITLEELKASGESGQKNRKQRPEGERPKRDNGNVEDMGGEE